MATLYNSISLRLMKFLLVLVMYSSDKKHFLESRKFNGVRHFQTIKVSSLLPDSVCKTTSTGSKTAPSTLKLTHRHGPCSTLTPDTTTITVTDILSNDQSRVQSIQARLTSSPTTDQSIDLPAQSGLPLNTANYIVTIGIGTPPKNLSLAFDTGSDLTWTQCQPCSVSCYKQQDPIFDPSSSSSYNSIRCSSSRCSQLSSSNGCNADTCAYQIQYGDTSFTLGSFATDTITLTPNDVFTGFVFGCGEYNNGTFGRIAGLLGLGRDPSSLVSQIATKYGKYFSYCLPSTPSSVGSLTLGKPENRPDSKFVFTPFATSNRGKSFYFIDIVGISVGGEPLQISQSVFQSGGTIIDSGTVITRLQPTAYSALSRAFKDKMTNYTSTEGVGIFDTCYDFGSAQEVVIPTISIVFGGNVAIDLDGSGILYEVGETKACLAFAPNTEDGDVAIYGNTQQKTFEVVYDVDGGKLGFGAGGCS